MLKVVRLSCVLMMAVVGSSMLLGCGGSDRLPLVGKVNVDGTAAEKGYIHFTPLPGTTGPTAGANIVDGAYEVESSKGLFEGDYQVAIKVWKESDKMTEDFMTGEKARGIVQVLPAKFNSKSELTVKLERGKKSYDFNLEP